jgi:phosphoglycerate dehydrogenase-like enzyme
MMKDHAIFINTSRGQNANETTPERLAVMA